MSTAAQAEEGVSLDAQRARVQAHAAQHGIKLVEIIEDAGESAASLDRPGVQRALAMLRAGQADALLVYKLDRLTRSAADLGELTRTVFAQGRASILSVTENIDTRTAGGRLHLRIMVDFAEYERDVIGERTAAALQHKAAQGEYTGGGSRYGFRVANPDAADDETKLVEKDPGEQAVILEARRHRARGLSLRAVAAELAAQGLRSREGKVFAAAQVARMLRP